MDISSGLEIKHTIAIIVHGFAAGVFAYAPIWIITLSSLKKLALNSAGSNHEHITNNEPYAYFFKGIVILAISMSIYYFFVMILDNLIFQNFAPITGDTGITRLFWEINIDQSAEEYEYSDQVALGMLSSVKLLREVFNTLAYFTTFLMIFGSFITAFSFFSTTSGGRKSIGSVLVPMIMSIILYMGVSTVFDKASSPILNKGITINEMAVEYLIEGIEMYKNSTGEEIR